MNFFPPMLCMYVCMYIRSDSLYMQNFEMVDFHLRNVCMYVCMYVVCQVFVCMYVIILSVCMYVCMYVCM